MSFISLLQGYPNQKTKRRAFLRVKFLENRKCFFEIFLHSKIKNYSGKDLSRRYPIAENLPQIFKTVKPTFCLHEGEERWVFESLTSTVVLKEIMTSKKQKELHLLSLYPK